MSRTSQDHLCLGRTWKRSSAGYSLIFLALFVLGDVLFSSSAAQENSLRREFSANVLLRMGAEEKGKGIGARVYVKQDELYLDFPDFAHRSHIPFWFLSDGLVASIQAATDEDFSPGAANPLLVGTLLRFRAANPDRFCEEFRPYYIGVLTAVAGEEDDQDARTLKRLQKPENFPCEQTGHDIVALRDCRIYRFAALSEYWTFVSFDPTLTTILQVRINPPQGLVVRLDAIKEEPQRSDLFVPPLDRVVLTHLKKPGRVPPQ